MEFSNTIILTTLTFFISIIFTLIHAKPRLNLPPGPPGWPIFGNLLQIAASGKPFFQYVRELLPEYGPIMTLQMGARTMIILSRADIIHQALIEQGHVFATRPPENPTRALFSSNKLSINSALYGPVWRSLRRNMVQNVLSVSRLRMFRNVRVMAMDKLINKLKSEAKENEGAVWVLKNARFTMFYILLTMCFGVEMDEISILEIDEMLKKVLMTIHPRLDDFLPLLRPLFYKQWKRASRVREQQLAMLVPLIEQRRRQRTLVMRNPASLEFCYVDTLFDLSVEGRDHPLRDPDIVTLCSGFLNGGADSTSTVIEWAIARLIERPSIQSRIYNEIKSVVGTSGQKINEKDV
ncbi:cytochrome P450 77A2-like [Bidens hawaiensis]|uniref:cytochrome P450 77A2-like n=1 Tax=Bidens hawaiensis TaxID=980011 RepID=UPI00404B11E6